MTARSVEPAAPGLPGELQDLPPLPSPLVGWSGWPPLGRLSALTAGQAARLRRDAWRDAAALVLLACAALAYAWPSIAAGQIAYENDTRIFYYPIFARLGAALKQGLLPLWSPQLFGGYPVFADGETGALYPLHLFLLLLLPVDTAFIWLRPIRFFQGEVFFYLFCRTIGLGRFGAIIGALSFAFSGFAIAQVHHTNISTSAMWLPLVLAFGELALRQQGRTRYAFALLAGVGFGLQALIIHVQVVLMSAAVFIAYCGYRAVVGPIGSVGPAGSARGPYALLLGRHLQRWEHPGLSGLLVRSADWIAGRLGLAAGLVAIAGATGAALGAVQLLPLYELGTFSFRGGGVEYAFATQYSLPPLQLISLLLPDFFVAGGQYWGLWSHWEVFAYAGIAPLLLALLALAGSRHRLVPFFAVIGAVALVLALGEYSPWGLHRWLSSLPGFSVLRAPGRFLFLFSVATASLAACGADTLARAWRARRPTGARQDVVLTTALLVVQLLTMAFPLVLVFAGTYVEGHKDVVIAWLQDAFVRRRGFDSRFTVEQLYQNLLAGLDLLQPGVLRQLALLLGTLAVLVFWDRVRPLGRLWQVALVGLIIIDLIGLGWRFHPTTSLAALQAPSRLVQFLASQPGVYRVYTQKGTPDEPDRLLQFGIADANGYSSLEPVRHQQFAAVAQYAPSTLLDLLNVRYYIVKNRFVPTPSFRLTSFVPGKPLLSSTARNPAGSGTYLLNGTRADTLRVVSTLRWAANVPQGTPVAQLVATGIDGRQYTFTLQAGVHTADWAWDRPDLKGKVAHQLPPIAYTWQERIGRAQPFPGHYYFAEFSFGSRVTLARLDVQFLHPTAQVEIFGLALLDSASGDSGQLGLGQLAKFKRVYADNDVLVYENQSYLPRAFLVPSVIIERPGDEVLDRMAHGDFSPERVVILEQQFDASRLPPPPPAGARVAPVSFNRPLGTEISSGPGSVSIRQLDADEERMEVVANQNAMLLVTDLYYPGWKAYLDGRETPIYRGDYLFRTIFIPAGRHTVEFVYHPRSFRLGLLLTLVATLGTTGALLMLVVRRPVPLARRRAWPRPADGVTMAIPGIERSTAGSATADGAASVKGAASNGRQEPEEHREKERAESGEGGQEEVAPSP